MSDWKRTTREISFEKLPPAMVSAINQHVEKYNLGPILSDALMCVQTDSEKPKKGLFGKAESVQMGMVVTPRWLVWAITGTTLREVVVLSAQLSHITVQDYAQTPFAKMVSDSGMEVSGIFSDARESASAFIALEAGGAGKKCRDVVIQAAQNAKKQQAPKIGSLLFHFREPMPRASKARS